MKTAIMFPGQGAQKVGMGEELFDRFPDAVKNADAILGYSIAELCRDAVKLEKTEFTQVAMYVVNALAFRKFIEDGGDAPDFFLGHSLGEYNALHAAGAFSFGRGLEIVKRRGELMSRAPKGAMAAVTGCPIQELKQFLDSGAWGLDIANLNSPTQNVVSGLVKEIDEFCKASAEKWTTFALRTGGAFHSRHMTDAASEFGDFLAGFEFDEPAIPVLRNRDGENYHKSDLASSLASQLSSPVDWVRSVEKLFDLGVESFSEIGDSKILTRLVAAIRVNYDNSNRGKKAQIEQTKAQPAQVVSDWNQRFPSGTRVRIKKTGDLRETRSKATLLFGSVPAIYLLGCKSYLELELVDPQAE